MARFTLTLDTENDSFGDDCYSRAKEIARILRSAAESLDTGGIEAGDAPWRLRDSNGNSVGAYSLTGDDSAVADPSDA